MRRKKENDTINKRKYLSIVGFIISIILLSLAITLSMNEEKIAREAKLDSEAINLKNSGNISKIHEASSDLNKKINEIKNQNTIEKSVENGNVTSSSTNTVGNEVVQTNGKTGLTDSNQINGNNTNEVDTSSVAENNKNTNTTQNSTVDNEAKNGDLNSKPQFIVPIDGEHLNEFSMDSLVYSNTLQEWITHRGIDIKAEKTSIVKASADGKIVAIKDDPRFGLSIIIEHSNGFKTVYSSLLSSEFVKEGDTVEQGQAIGTVGNSAVFETAEGSHLHFEILKDGEYINPDIYVK